MDSINVLTSYSDKTYYKQLFSEYTKPIDINIFNDNLDFLKKDQDYIPFNNDLWTMKPEVFCLDHYKHMEFWPIILTCNNILTLFNFTQNNMKNNEIQAPQKEKITKLISLIV